MIGLGSDKNIHMMTIKSNCSQLQVHCDKISDVVGDICCATAIFDSLYSGVEYTVGKAPTNIVANHTEHETLPTLTFSIPKYSLWINKVVRHTCTVVFCRLIVWLSMEG